MFEELLGKATVVVVHKIAPYAAERQRFLAHCREQGFGKACLQQMARILLIAAIDLEAHGGLNVSRRRLEAAANRVDAIRSSAGLGGHAAARCEFLRVTRQWLLFVGHLRSVAIPSRPYAALVDDFVRWMVEERGLAQGTVKNRRCTSASFWSGASSV